MVEGPPLRIGISCYPSRGGSGVVATELGVALAERGHEVHFVSYEPPFRLPRFHERIFHHSVDVPIYPLFRYPSYDLALASRMCEVAEQRELDLFHVHYAIPHSVCGVLARQMAGRDLRIVTTLHGTDITLVGSDASYRGITRFAIERSDAVTAVSAWLKHETVRVFGVGDDVEVIPNFVDTERFQPRSDGLRERLTGCPDGLLMMHLSNFRGVKRIPDVVEVFRRTVEAGVDAHLALAGEGPERAGAERAIEEAGLTDRVCLLGTVDAVETVLPAADLFLLPSDHESFGLAALEAQACGVPVVGTASGGLPEVVEDGVTGRLHDVGDVEAMAESCRTYLVDADARAEAGRAARARAVDHFERRLVVPRYLELYRRTVADA